MIGRTRDAAFSGGGSGGGPGWMGCWWAGSGRRKGWERRRGDSFSVRFILVADLFCKCQLSLGFLGSGWVRGGVLG